MRKPFLAIIIAFFIIVTCSNASSLRISEYNITFDILPDMGVNETVSMAFPEMLNSSSLNYMVVGEISGLSISNGKKNLDYVLEKSGSEQNVKFTVPEGTERLAINFIAKDLVFAKDNVHGFFTNLNPPSAERISIRAILPKGYAVYNNVVYPEGYEIRSDGERIYLLWNLSSANAIAISFKFNITHTDYSLAVFAFMILALAGVTFYLVIHYRKRMKKEFVRGFSEDERKVLLILSKNKTCMQNKIEKELKFSRSKMTRIVKKLEAKGLVEKERVGRTNRLFYKK